MTEQITPHNTGGSEGLSGPDAPEALRRRVWRSLPPVTAALTALYIVFTISHAFLLPDGIRGPMVAVAGGTAILLLGLNLAVRRSAGLERFAHSLAFLIMVLLCVNSALHLSMTRDIVQSTNVMLVILGAGFFILPVSWYLSTVAVALLTWLLAAAGLPEQTLFVHFAFALCSATLASAVFRLVHVKELLDNHRLRLDSEQQRREMEHLATHDFLTGLANRRKFLDRLTLEIAHANRSGRKVGVLYIDLDDFKLMNDTHGHRFGDRVLQECGRMLSETIRQTDLVSRDGGDEFAVLLTNLKENDDIDLVVAKILQRFDRAESINDIETKISLSVGKAVLPDDGDVLDEVLRIADERMYAHKQGRKRPTAGTRDSRRDRADSPHADEEDR